MPQASQHMLTFGWARTVPDKELEANIVMLQHRLSDAVHVSFMGVPCTAIAADVVQAARSVLDLRMKETANP